MMTNKRISGRVHRLGEAVNTDLNCSSKYQAGRDNAYIAERAFESVSPGFAKRFKRGDVVVAGKNFGINSSREQAVHIMRDMGVAAIIAPSFARLFFRNGINNGLSLIECDVSGIVEGDDIEVDLAQGKLSVAASKITRSVAVLPPIIRRILTEGGLIAFLKKFPDWKLQ